MIISRSQKILFVHVPRTGGSSIRNLLHRCLPDAESFHDQHDGITRAQASLGEDSDLYFSFGFVRHPLDRLASWFAFLCTHGTSTEKASAEAFERYLSDARTRGELPPSQSSYLSDERGKLQVSRWGRFELLESDLREILAEQGIEAPRLDHLNENASDSRWEGYTKASRELVAVHYAEDFERFGYDY